jgi:uncharacterized protein YbaR (Trm112 family)
MSDEIVVCPKCKNTDIETCKVRHSEMEGNKYKESHESLECICQKCTHKWLLCNNSECKFNKYKQYA